MEVNQTLKHITQLNAESHYVGLIKLEKQSIINGCKKNQEELNISLLIILKYLLGYQLFVKKP